MEPPCNVLVLNIDDEAGAFNDTLKTSSLEVLLTARPLIAVPAIALDGTIDTQKLRSLALPPKMQTAGWGSA